MTIMLAGGMAIAAPGMEPAYAANPHLKVSAEEIGNFAGIQVIEIVITDPERSDTSDPEGIPNVDIDGFDVRMIQSTDGFWYAYIASQIGISTFEDLSVNTIDSIYGNSTDADTSFITGSAAQAIVYEVDNFLDGFKVYNTGQISNHDIDATHWPFIQTYNIGDGNTVTITYGSGSTAQNTTIEYDYDDTKDITLDRSVYPENGQIFISIDDSLLNLSPTADEVWIFDGERDYGTLVIGDGSTINTKVEWKAAGFETGAITFDNGDDVYEFVDTEITSVDSETAKKIIFRPFLTDDNLFVNWNIADLPGLKVVSNGEASISYDRSHSVLMESFTGTIAFGVPAIEEWLSGVELDISLQDEDRNLTTKTDETLSILEDEVPYIKIGNPIHIDDLTLINTDSGGIANTTLSTLTNSETIQLSVLDGSTTLFVNATWPYTEESNTLQDNGLVLSYINYDFTTLNGTSGTFYAGSPDLTIIDKSPTGVTNHSNSTHANFAFTINAEDATGIASGIVYYDVLSFGQKGELETDGDINDNVSRVNDAIYRLELEETDLNTANYKGTVEYIMINQLNVFDDATYDRITTTGDTIVIIVNDNMDGSDGVTVSYYDVDSTGNNVTISTLEDALTHTGTIELDNTSYSAGNTISVILTDVDLNTDSDTRQNYRVHDVKNWVGNSNVWLSQLLINDVPYDGNCDTTLAFNATGFTLTETTDASGIFVGTLKLPSKYCDANGNDIVTNGLDLNFDYQDYSDASGKPNQSSDSASIRSNTGSVSLDRSVYPVPFEFGQFPHYGIKQSNVAIGDNLAAGDVTVTIKINDPDFNLAASGEDVITNGTDANIFLTISRGSDDIRVEFVDKLVETDPRSGIFEVDVIIPQKDYSGEPNWSGTFIEQGDILSVIYEDPTDASGDINTVTDSATFDLRNAVMQSDKPVYIIGSDAIITLIEPDLDLDSNTAETWSLDLINWDSDAGSTELSDSIFDASTSGLRETGENTGVFQVVIEIPSMIDGDHLERGEQITLEYTDWGPAGASYVSDDDEDISVDIFTSNFGATVELDQKLYTWTDKVYITIVAPDHNFDSDSIDEIGTEGNGEITISTRESELDFYKLVETGPDTGIFTGEVILTGFTSHDADGDGGGASGAHSEAGPTGGLLEAGHDGGLTVSFEFSNNESVIGSALIRWNIGEVQWLEASYPASGSGVIRVIDPDMNLNPESVDSFDVNVWSDTASGGISLRITETSEPTGIFEGTVFFTTSGSSSGSRLAVSEGDTVTAEYVDRTLPDPHSIASELDIRSTTLIGTLVPPLERVPAANLRIVDAFGNNLSTVTVDKQITVQADVANGQQKVQPFAYLVQIQNGEGVTVSLASIADAKGLQPDQQMSPALSWIPTESGEYTITAFVWESISNPTALSPPISTTITVS